MAAMQRPSVRPVLPSPKPTCPLPYIISWVDNSRCSRRSNHRLRSSITRGEVVGGGPAAATGAAMPLPNDIDRLRLHFQAMRRDVVLRWLPLNRILATTTTKRNIPIKMAAPPPEFVAIAVPPTPPSGGKIAILAFHYVMRVDCTHRRTITLVLCVCGEKVEGLGVLVSMLHCLFPWLMPTNNSNSNNMNNNRNNQRGWKTRTLRITTTAEK